MHFKKILVILRCKEQNVYFYTTIISGKNQGE